VSSGATIGEPIAILRPRGGLTPGQFQTFRRTPCARPSGDGFTKRFRGGAAGIFGWKSKSRLAWRWTQFSRTGLQQPNSLITRESFENRVCPLTGNRSAAASPLLRMSSRSCLNDPNIARTQVRFRRGKSPRHIIMNEYFTHASSVRLILAPRQQRGDADVAEVVALWILPDESLAPAVDFIRDCSEIIARESHA
jgi:hypothetical protein